MISRQRATLTHRGLAFASAGTTLLLGGVFLGYRDVTRIACLLLALLAATYVMARRSRFSVAVERTTRPPVVPLGARVAVRADLRNTGRRRTRPAIAEEHLDYSLGDRPRFVLPSLEAGAARHLDYVLVGRRRGIYGLGPIELMIRDPFGLTERRATIDQVDPITVLPRVVPLGSSHPPGSGEGTEGHTPAMVALHGEDDVSIRGYRDGDDLRRVHWKASAHRGELMVRQVDRPALRSCVLMLDPRAAMHGGSGDAGSFEWAVTAIASIGVRMLELGYLVHLVSREALAADATGEPVEGDRLLTLLAGAAPGSAQDYLAIVQRAEDLLGAGTVIIAAVGADQGGAADLARLRQPGAAAIGLVLDRANFGGAHGASEEALDVRDRLAEAGWRSAVVGSRDTQVGVWTSLASRSLVRVGAP